MGAVKCTVESMNYSACGLQVGDSFEIRDGRVSIHGDRDFCFFAMTSLSAALAAHAIDGDVEEWLATKPLISCPDAPEDLRVRVERIETSPTDH